MNGTSGSARRRRRRAPAIIGALFAALGGSIVLSVFFGALGPIGPGRPLAIPLDDFLATLVGASDRYAVVLWQLRFPRALLAALVGATLALSGVGMQGLFRNPLAEPYVLGISSGAALGATLWFLYGTRAVPSSVALPLFAFLAAVATIAAVYVLGRVNGALRTDTLLLAGVSIGSFLTALTFFFMYLSSESLNRIVFWLLGGFNLSAQPWRDVGVLLPVVVIGASVLFLFRRDLNALLLGEEAAHTLGVDPELTKRVVLTLTALLTASAVAVSGIIGFVGLVIPHAVRLVVGPDHRRLIPAAIAAGALFLLWGDVVARTMLAPEEMPVGIVTAFLGTPFFVYLLRTRRRGFHAA